MIRSVIQLCKHAFTETYLIEYGSTSRKLDTLRLLFIVKSRQGLTGREYESSQNSK